MPPHPLEHLDTTPVIERNAVETLLGPPRYGDTTPPPRSDSPSQKHSTTLCQKKGLNYVLLYPKQDPDMEAVNAILVNHSEALETAFQKITQ